MADTTRFYLVQRDAVSWLEDVEDNSFDAMITDPPYESLERHRAIGTTTRLKQSNASSNLWFQIFPNNRFPAFFREAYRVLKHDAHLYLFCDIETMFVVKPMAEAEGFRFWKPIIWDKVRIGMGYHYRSRYECILFFEKGHRRLNDLSVPDILTAPRIHRGYPTEKPVDISKTLIRQCTSQGADICDPFMGSGSVGVAAIELGRSFYGADIHPDALKISAQRITKAGGILEKKTDRHARRQLGLLFEWNIKTA